MENANNNLGFEIRLTSANVSASINGDNLWMLDRVFTNTNADGTGTIKKNEDFMNPVLTMEQANRGMFSVLDLFLFFEMC